MNRIPLVIATLSALSIIAVVSCTEAKVPTTGSEISQSFSALAKLFSTNEPGLTAQASTSEEIDSAADEIARDPEALAFAKSKAQMGQDYERAAAAAVLARIDDPKAVAELCNMVEDNSKEIRDHVYVALQRHNTPEARAGLTKALHIYGLEAGLTEVICDVMDPKMWAETSEVIIMSTEGAMEFNIDLQSIQLLIESAKEHEFETGHFDKEEFAKKMEEFGRKMKEKFGKEGMTIEVEVDEGDSTIS